MSYSDYEASVVKPSTMLWFETNGYSWKQEYKFPNSQKRIDFLATNKLNGLEMLVECKTGKYPNDVGNAIAQLEEYVSLHQSKATPVLVYPSNVLTTRSRNLIAKHNIALVELTTLITANQYFYERVWSKFEEKQTA